MSQLQVTGEAKIRDIQGPVVANDGVITALDGAANQYVRGDGTLASFPTSGGGGSSVSYYLNGSVNQGTFGGSTYYQMSKNAIVGTGTNFSASANGLIAQFITDANDPDVVSIPSGNWNLEFFMNVSASSGALASFYVEIYKYNGSTFTLLATNSATPEQLTNTTTVDAYYTSVAMPTSALSITDRLAIRIYANVASKTVTLYTEDNRLCQVVTTFSKGLASLNNLTDQSQYLATGTSGTNFAIVSSGDTHTFNLPVASATNTGKLSNTDWSTFNAKIGGSGTTNTIPKFTASGTIGDSSLSDDSGTLRYQGIGFRGLDIKSTNNSTSIRLESYSASTNSDNGIKEIEMNGYYSSFNSYFGYNSSGAEWRMFGYADTAANTTNRGTTTWQIPSLDGTYGYFDVKSYHSATPIIRAFASNNVVIGGSTNNSFKLEVVGTTKISGVLTLGSTISNGTNTYTLPSATGTLALTSNLSSYVPYTGATASVNLGVYALSSSVLYADGLGSIAGFLYLKQNTTTSQYLADYSAIGAYSNGYVFNIATPSVSKQALLDLSLITASASRTYTLPDLSGTLALTSDLNGYVPYNGATTGLDLGIYSYNGNSVLINGNGTTQNGTLLFKQGGALAFNSTGYSGIGILGTTSMHFNFNQSSGVYKQFNFNVLGLTNNTLRTLNIPDATGTIALTSDLSAYVTLATNQTISGLKTFTALATNNEAVGIKLTSGVVSTGGYLTLNAKVVGTLHSLFLAPDSTSNRAEITFDNTALRTYALPNASGTLALTSNLSAYLPLTGGTLTGALSGTSATFLGKLTIGNSSLAEGEIGIFETGGNYNFTTFKNGVVRTIIGSQSSTSQGFLGTASNHDLLLKTNDTTRLTIASTGNATFSNSVISNGGTFAAFNGGSLEIYNTGTTNFFELKSTGGNFALRTNVGISPVNALTIASTGAATFSSTITAATLSTIGTAVAGQNVQLNLNGVSGKAQRIEFQNSGVQQWLLGAGAASETSAFELFNSTGVIALSVNKSTNAATFSSSVTAKTSGDYRQATLGTSTGAALFITNTSYAGYGLLVGNSYSYGDAWLQVGRIDGTATAYNLLLQTSGGNVLIGTTSDSGAKLTARFASSGNPTISATNTNASNSRCYYGQKASGSTDDYYMIFDNAVDNKFLFYGNGGLGNVQANNVNISDERTKKEIIPLESYWDKIKAIEIVKFKYKDQTHDDFNIGVIAQQVEAVAPEFIEAEDWGKDTPTQTQEPLKSVYTTDLYHATIKVLQEAMARIEEQQAQIEELKALINK